MLYDKNLEPLPDSLPKEVQDNIFFTDGGFYTFLKYLIHKATDVPNSNISQKNYGENNPFLQQGSDPKVFLELIDYGSPTMSGFFDSDGNMNIIMNVKYRIYFCNDPIRSPLLFESALKGNPDIIRVVMEEFFETYKDKVLYSPQTITMNSKKNLKNDGIYQIICYDISMIGYQVFNIEYLKNVPFDKFSGGINIENK